MPTAKLNRERANDLFSKGATVREVATALGVSTQAVYAALSRGQIARPANTAAA